MASDNLSEYRIKPELVIVHDPTAFGAFERFPSFAGEKLLNKFLFRDHPCIEAVQAQHRNFVAELEKRVRVAYLADILLNTHAASYNGHFAVNPNYLFTRDALITVPWIPDGYILGRMRKEPRMGEPAVMETVARLLGLWEIVSIPSNLFLEGGDVIPIVLGGKKVFVMGYGPRTSKETLEFFRRTLVRDGVIDEIIGFEIAPWRLNVDGCFFPLGESIAVAQRDSIVGGVLLGWDYSDEIDPLSHFEQYGFTVIEVTKEESYLQQACNFACLGEGTFIAYNMTERINDALRARGLEIISVPGTELVKGNGGPHCMARPVYKAG